MLLLLGKYRALLFIGKVQGRFRLFAKAILLSYTEKPSLVVMLPKSFISRMFLEI